MTTRYWIGVVSENHVKQGVEKGFAQVCHGKSAPLKKMKKDDWLIYYSPKTSYPNGRPLQSFTAIGKVKSGEVYPFQMSQDFIPFRIDVDYQPCKVIPYSSVKSLLQFAQNHANIGLLMKRGHFEINKNDFLIISSAMGVSVYGMEV